ncbi:MAG TPA: LacI family DNA-binding transcriptional regulator [Mycobacteriales bacterium]|nr:LacI family DNA-binding transcriptional regulator [Mycobacteriales bacterium]
MDRAPINIADIARRAGVSNAAVSYALNGRPGVSSSTRRRIVDIADQLGWRPNSSARALHRSRTDAVGITMVEPEPRPVVMPEFLLRFLPGVQEDLTTHGILLVLHSSPDIATANEAYRQWRNEKRVDGVIVLNPLVRDRRLRHLEELGLPAVVVGDARRISSLSSVRTDDEQAMRLGVAHLMELGHRRIGRIGIRSDFLHSRGREQLFHSVLRKAGLRADLSTYHALEDPLPGAVLDWLATDDPPTAIIHEDCTTAIEMMLALQARGVRIPADVSLLCWDDAILARAVNPQLTVLRRNVFDYGRRVAQQLRSVIETGEHRHLSGSETELVIRQSTAPAS